MSSKDDSLQRLGQRLWKIFSSVKLAVGLFLVLAVLTLVGSIIVQEPIAQPGQIEKLYSPETIRWFKAFGLLDLYHSWWYTLLLTLLAVNLTITSIDMWPRFYARIYGTNRFGIGLKPDYKKNFPGSSDSNLRNRLRSIVVGYSRDYSEEEKDGKTFFFAQRGKWAHLGVYVIHTGIVITLLGGAIRGRLSFEGNLTLAAGEQSNSFELRSHPGQRRPLGFTVKATGVRMEKYPDGSPSAYYSDLEIYDQGKLAAQKTIRVNDPLEYKGIYFYQANYGQEAYNERLEAVLEIMPRGDKKTETIKVTLGQPHPLPGKKGYEFAVVDYRENFEVPIAGHQQALGPAVQVGIRDPKGEIESLWVFQQHPDFDKFARPQGDRFVLKKADYLYDVRDFTGLQVASNPFINIIWFGCTLLMLGLCSTFLYPHRKIWIIAGPDSVELMATAHRNPGSFRKRFDRLSAQVQQALKVEDGKNGTA